ncbi:dolichol kinase-like [Littorina saxatilis]|uniref:dolichol kinase n=1 Tax=Littorina saxatilis TaxID=31220 RepID=A0AAN9C371_9CAEN
MEPSPPEKRGMRGEESLMTLIVLKAVGSLMLQSQTEEWFSVGDWSYIAIAGCLVLQVLAVYNFPVRKKDGHSEISLFRPGVSCGVHCVLLVPLAVLAEALPAPSSETGNSERLPEVTFLLATGCGMLLLVPSQLKLKNSILYFVLVISSSVFLMLSCFYAGGFLMPWLIGFVVVMCTAYYLPTMCPLSFTFGELSVVCHILGSAIFRMVSWMDVFAFDERRPVVTHELYVYNFISVLLLFVTLASVLVFSWDWCDNIIPFILVYVACALMAIGTLMFLTDHQPLLWLFVFIFGENRRISLLVWWSAVAVITIIGFTLYTQHLSTNPSGKGNRASTTARKVFHMVVVGVYVPGLAVDPFFLLLASVVAFAVLCVLEVSRLINVQWLGSAVENSFRVFVDDRDQGPVLLTHVYLLVGLSLPLWLSHRIVVGDIRNYCGVISLGIGDTVACVVGMRYGNTKWPGTKKSVQGTLASVFAQLVFIIFSFYVGWLENLSWLNTVFAVLVSSVFEAFVSQIDNLVLSLFMMAALPSIRL